MSTASQDAPATAEPTTTESATTAAPMDPEARHREADRLVRQYALGGMATGLVPIPIADLAALVAVQLKLLHSLAGVYDIEFRADLGRSAVGSLLGSLMPSLAAPSVAASLGKLIPGVGQLLGTGTLVLLNGAATYAIGKVFTQHFASGGTFLTFDPETVRDYFAAQFEEGRTVVSDLKEQAAARKQSGAGAAAGDGKPTGA